MRRALLLGTAAAASALLAVAWARGGGSPTFPPAIVPAPPLELAREPEGAAPAVDTARNPFEFGRQERPARPSETPLPRERRGAVLGPSPPSDPVRLVGVVRRGGEARAALSILGEVVILAPGETASGYRLLAIDEDLGARLLTSSGTEVTASPAP